MRLGALGTHTRTAFGFFDRTREVSGAGVLRWLNPTRQLQPVDEVAIDWRGLLRPEILDRLTALSQEFASSYRPATVVNCNHTSLPRTSRAKRHSI